MNNDHTRITAETCANGCGQVTSGNLSMMRGLRLGGAACVLALAVLGPLHAQDRGGFRKDDQQQQQRDNRGDNHGGGVQRQDVPRFEPRVVDDVRRQQQDRNMEAQRHSGRLTPDERRDLRRQINEAGVDLYPNTPRR